MEKGLTKYGWHNVSGSSKRDVCNCGTWKQHWINFSSTQWPKTCSRESCVNIAEVGAHLRNDSLEGERIVPFCRNCNGFSSEDFLELKIGAKLVLANRALTCGKS